MMLQYVQDCCSQLSNDQLIILEPLLRLVLRDLLVSDGCWPFTCCPRLTLSFLFFHRLSRLLRVMLLSRLSPGSSADVEGS